MRVLVVDSADSPVEGATVELDISGPETATLTSSASGADGIAEASWNTSAPNRKGNGGTAPGSYTVTTVNVTADGYTWDVAETPANFTLN